MNRAKYLMTAQLPTKRFRTVPRSAQPQPLAAIGAAHDALPPALVVEVPAHGLAQPVLEAVARPPAELGR